MTFKDYFSQTAHLYAKYRPGYPAELYEFIVGHCQERKECWDVATGNGQAALDLTRYFEKVIATEPSSSQISNAKQHPKIQYVLETAEEASDNSPLRMSKVDLVTVACALHWFDHEKFYERVRQVLKPGGLIAAWTYSTIESRDEPKINDLVEKYNMSLKDYWPPERSYIQSHYKTIPWPFAKVYPDQPDLIEGFTCKVEWSREQLESYLYTFSASNRYVEQTGKDPMLAIREDLIKVWGDVEKRKLECPLYLLLGKV